MKITTTGGPEIPREFMGLFLEDINYAVDGGLYAEMLENRNFESMDLRGGYGRNYYGTQDGLYGWYGGQGSPEMEVVQGSPVNRANPHYLRVTCGQGGGSFWNKGYDGLYMRPGVACRVSFYARRERYEGPISVAVVEGGEVVDERLVELRPAGSDGWNRWQRYQLELRADREVRGGRFTVRLLQPGTVEFDWFSMIPEDAVLGVFRRDLAEALKALRPGFLRFPGGCVTEGANLANRYRFQDTLGPLEGRRFNWNRWAVEGNCEENGYHGRFAHYGQTYGIGFYEYFLLCEYLGAKPLPVLGVGMACQYQSYERVEPEDPEIRTYIQDFLDLIEFANGGPETCWGGVRCRMGHPEPFGLEMVGVGNEQWETPESRFFERYALFEREIHRVYPQIRLIGTAGPELDSPRFEAAWRFYRENEGKKDFVYAVDEHFYTAPEWFLTHWDYFDRVSRRTKIFFGEYAAHPAAQQTEKLPDRNTLGGALAEAAFLTGMARNSDAVIMTCYAPLLARMGYAQWSPNLIWFDEKEVCRTPSYFVQQMFARHLGRRNVLLTGGELPCQASYDPERGELALMLVNASAEPRRVPLEIADGWRVRLDAVEETVLAGADPSDANTVGREAVRPVCRRIALSGDYELPPYAFSVLRIPAACPPGFSE